MTARPGKVDAMDREAAGRGQSRRAAPLVSIGMPVFNGAAYIGEAIESILAQSLDDLELVICDNASTDATPCICEGFARADSRVRFLRNPRNLGAHPNYNRTFHESKGRYFKWAPHDDVLHREYLAACVGALEAAPDAVLCQTLLEYIDADGHPLAVYDSALEGTGSEDPVRRFAPVVLRPHPSYEVMGLVRRSALERSVLLQSFHGADKALVAELALRGPFLKVRRPLLQVRDHKDRYTRAKTLPKERSTWHDTTLDGRISLPVWNLYRGYWSMLRRNLTRGWCRWRARAVLVAWWFRNYNGVRMVVDLAAIPFPSLLQWAEHVKHALISPAPGSDSAQRPGRRTPP